MFGPDHQKCRRLAKAARQITPYEARADRLTQMIQAAREAGRPTADYEAKARANEAAREMWRQVQSRWLTRTF